MQQRCREGEAVEIKWAHLHHADKVTTYYRDGVNRAPATPRPLGQSLIGLWFIAMVSVLVAACLWRAKPPVRADYVRCRMPPGALKLIRAAAFCHTCQAQSSSLCQGATTAKECAKTYHLYQGYLPTVPSEPLEPNPKQRATCNAMGTRWGTQSSWQRNCVTTVWDRRECDWAYEINGGYKEICPDRSGFLLSSPGWSTGGINAFAFDTESGRSVLHTDHTGPPHGVGDRDIENSAIGSPGSYFVALVGERQSRNDWVTGFPSCHQDCVVAGYDPRVTCYGDCSSMLLFTLSYDGSGCRDIMESPLVTTVKFKHFMFGPSVGELKLTNAAGQTLWSARGDQYESPCGHLPGGNFNGCFWDDDELSPDHEINNEWHEVTVNVYSPSFAFEYRQKGGDRGDAALAEVQVSCGVAPPPPPAQCSPCDKNKDGTQSAKVPSEGQYCPSNAGDCSPIVFTKPTCTGLTPSSCVTW